MDRKLVSIIVPAYKKQDTIKHDIENIYDAMCQSRWDFEIIVVVDGFVDSTFKLAKELEKNVIRVFGYKTNRGKGYAVKYGMARALGDYLAFIDAGLEINPNGISMILEHMEWYDADIIVASKRHPVSKVHYPFTRKLYSWGYFTIIKLLFGVKVRDTQTGLKVYRREVLEAVIPRLVIKEYAFDIELLAVSHYLGFRRIYEAPVEVKFDFTTSRIKGFLIFDEFIRRMLHDTFAIFYRMHILKYYHDNNKRKWVYDKELEMQLNTGESEK